jgi:release factor glutamine methyltransferase
MQQKIKKETMREPIEFNEIKIFADKEVYFPREDSLLLAECIKIKKNSTVLDLGCGTGLIGLIAAKQKGKVLCADINPKAIALTKRNAKENKIKIKTTKSNLFSEIKEKFDFIYFNPPYTIKENKRKDWIEKAINGGKKGREIIDEFIPQIKKHLTKKGKCFFLQSSLNGIKETKEKLEREGLKHSIEKRKKLFFEELIVFKVWF